MKKILMILGAILTVAFVAGGSFWGGMKYQDNQVIRAQANFENARGQVNGAQPPAGGQFPVDGQGYPGGRDTSGEMKAIDGNVMTLSTAQDVTSITLTGSTQIEKTVTGATADLQPGVRVMVTGETDSDGNIAASQVTIIDNNPAVMASPSSAETEP